MVGVSPLFQREINDPKRNALGRGTMKPTGGNMVFAIRVVLVLALALGLSAPLAAQIQNGTFSGVVTDQTGAVVPGAEVKVTNLGTSFAVVAKTDGNGLYRATELPVGTYKIEVSAAGFKKAVHTNLALNAGTTQRVDFQLALGQATEVITVEGGAPLVNTEDSRLYETVSRGQVANMPLNGRNVFDLIQLAPGAVNVTGIDFENGHSTVVNGLRPDFIGFLQNGVSNKGLSGGVNTVPNADIVEEFQELTLNMSAQYGNSAAAIVNVVTKSGTNSLHGSAYEFLRNDKLDANAFFFNQQSEPRPPLHFNQFGGTVTGPIWKDHLFFTGSYQGDRFITSAPPTPIISETPEWRAAVIAALPNSVAAKIYANFPTKFPGNYNGPDSTDVQGFVGTDFSGYTCPSNYPTGFTNIATTFQTLFGVTAAEATACPGLVANGGVGMIPRNTPFLNDNALSFPTQTQGNLFNGNEWSTRIDWVKGQNDRVFGEYYWLHSADSFGPANASSGIHNFKNPTANHFPNFQASWVHTFSPNLINEAKAGYVLNRGDTNVAVPGVPSVGFDDGSAGFGSYNGYPQFFHENIYSYGDLMSLQKGKHSLKFGADFRRNIENSEFNIARPSYYFFDQLFFAADAPYGLVAGVDPGFISNKSAQLADNFRHWRNLEIGAFVQDDWKVSRKLTLNIGVRYDLFSRHTEKLGKVTTFLPGPGCSVPANGYCADAIFNANGPAGAAGDTTPFQ